jgi:hypothetical protein
VNEGDELEEMGKTQNRYLILWQTLRIMDGILAKKEV